MSAWDQAAVDAALAKCESPIERKLLPALVLMEPRLFDPDVEACFLVDHPHCRLVPQCAVSGYRTDFAFFVTIPGLGEMRVGIEADGFEYHDATREQAARDKQRDRHFRILEWTMLRFAGTEINASATHCAAQVAAAIDAEFERRIRTEAELDWQRRQGRNDVSLTGG